MAVALVLILIALGSVAFHLLSPWWWTPIASNWGYIDQTIIITFAITGIVFTAIVLFMAFCVLRYRHREGRRAVYEPESKRLESWLTILTAIGIVLMLAPGLATWREFVSVPAGASEIEVVSQQWAWNFRLPGKDGKLGGVATAFVSPDNPLGINPADAAGQDDVVIQADDLHLALGRPTKLLLRSLDVVHDFYVPEFRAKMDMMPGMVTYLWFTPQRTGTFEILCNELCGTGHPAMRGKVVVDGPAEYQDWLAKQKTFAEMAKSPTRYGQAGHPAPSALADASAPAPQQAR